jgi:hypothetical protein
MKLKDWADKQGISYLTAWRWFKAGDPRLSHAYQSDSGTIIVPEDNDSSEKSMGITQSNDVMSMVLKKTVELSKNNSSIEDFAAWILSTFNLKLNTVNEGPRYSRNKPAPEMVQNHFKQFLKPKGDKPKPNMFVAEPEAFDDLMAKADDLTTQELVDEIHKIGAEGGVSVNPTDAPEVGELMKDLSAFIDPSLKASSVKFYNENKFTEGGVTRSVDLTPQLNYTGSTNSAFSNNSLSVASTLADGGSAFNSVYVSADVSGPNTFGGTSIASHFQPTQKETELVARATELVDKRRRGRKPSKITGNK